MQVFVNSTTSKPMFQTQVYFVSQDGLRSKIALALNKVEFHALCELKGELTTLYDQYIEHGYIACFGCADTEPHCICCKLKQVTEYPIGEECKMILTKNWEHDSYDHSISIHLVRPTYPEFNALMSFNEFLSVCMLESKFNNLINQREVDNVGKNGKNEKNGGGKNSQKSQKKSKNTRHVSKFKSLY